jgi:hypothetical protein
MLTNTVSVRGVASRWPTLLSLIAPAVTPLTVLGSSSF